MMKRAALFLFIACWAVSALSLAEDGKESKPSATDSPAEEFVNITTTTVKSPTTITTTKTTATTTTTASTTPKSTTKSPTTTKSTTKPPTTTKSTTKPPTTTKSTTKPPTTTKSTTKPPTTTKSTTTSPTTTKTTIPTPPQPTPGPTKDSVGNYTLMADKTVMCVMAQMALKIRLAIPKDSGTFVVQPNITKVEGSCKGTKANLTLVFKEGFITFIFNQSIAEDRVFVDTLSFSLSYPLIKDTNMPYTASNKSLHLFEAKVAHSYSCKAESVFMGNGLYLDVTQDRMQAFNLTKSNDFGTPDPCPADKPDYRVAIAVGVTLLVLIIIVVVAYLLGRRRRTGGYQSL
ncbi:lysosome-associated membrane glycoprotein 1 isoform X2 [Sebastes fasciatus]|uniref:lysosome-associated membrane glycoprotein 1 isoform X2 n=1 Tax=Sebastes fasciatus TaxID=394691 RepID=UPI003D9EB492